MAHLPPPVNGVTIMGEQVVNSHLLREHFQLEVLPLKSASSIEDIGKLRPAKLLLIVSQVRDLARHCLVRRPELVYFTLTPNGRAFYRDLLYVAIMKLCGARRLYHLHGKGIAQAMTGPLKKALYTWAFQGAQVVLLSPSLYEDASQVVKRKQCHFLANGIVDPLKGRETDTVHRDGVPRILFFSNLFVNKGIFILLEALKLLKQRGVPFRASFAGAWESKAVETEFGKILHENQLQELTEFCGPRYGDDKWRTFAEADIMAFPTYNDAYPLVVLEAMGHGLPVLATYEGAIPDMIQDSVTGFLVPRLNPLIVADRLALLLTDRGLRERMGKAGRERYLSQYTLGHFEENLCSILEKCIKRR